MNITSVNPATGKVLAKTPCTSVKEVGAAVARAAKAFPLWASEPVARRVACMQELKNHVQQHAAALQELLIQEIGKSPIEAVLEVEETLATIDYYCKMVQEVSEKSIFLDQSMYPNTSAVVQFVPHSVVGLITPWNYPLILTFWTLVPALLTGNTVVYKPSRYATLIGKKINELAQSVFPEGVFHTLIGDARLGMALVQSSIDKLFFTGSVKTGQQILKKIGIKPAALELGGKNASIICSDADLSLAVQGTVWGAFANTGQCCVASSTTYIEASVFADVAKRIIAAVSSLKIGPELRPLANEEQLRKVTSLVADARKKGAKILCGGKRIAREGFWFEPTVITGIKPTMKISTEEIFGPVIVLIPVKTALDAVSLINAGMYGLGVSIWTKNNTYANTLTQKINIGMVWINDVGLPLPGGDYWGGAKASGMRNTESKIMQCLKAKTVLKYDSCEKRRWWYPYDTN